ncbi:amino acid ABC transporter substrate-binding protein (PAAT family) [Murinocardiopsis flavida]|uniref:Amino acid ABC transporter substrate-binding protein (PAAT family) n=1 Tax=Murinocardiopsis flavida TaxID=645275 RepID=A0A2P8DUX0_9ACTN|nr:glutamate ABC transporter substrate-binding protein [Murinocardiopsis flavida]PSL00984.1 amino acid ABC transporter substrate-binding protein (PAAT family) [Murinocardiopsis flavida]
MRAHRIGSALAGAAALALAVTACGAPAGSGGDSGGGGGDGDKLVIGTKYDQPGLGLEKEGKPEGFDVDVAKYVAKELGYEENQIEWKETISDNREGFLQQKTVDMVLATYSITDERKQVVSFAGPYYVAQQDILVPAEDKDSKKPEDMKGKTLCAAAGSRSADTITETLKIDAQTRKAGNYSECMQLLDDGTIDAVTTDNTILAGFSAQQEGKFRLLNNPFQEERYGVGLPKNSDKCEKIDEAITKMWESGEAEKMLEKHFGPAGLEYDKKQPELDGCE